MLVWSSALPLCHRGTAHNWENVFQGWLSPRQIDCMFPGIHFGPHPFWPFLASCIALLISEPIMWHQECCQYWQFNPSRVWRLFYPFLVACHLSDWFHGETCMIHLLSYFDTNISYLAWLFVLQLRQCWQPCIRSATRHLNPACSNRKWI